MALLSNFGALTSSEESLLKSSYSFGTLALLKLNVSKSNLNFHTRVSQRRDQNLLASSWLSISNDYFSLKHKRSTEKYSQYKLEISPKDQLKNFKIVCDCRLWGIEKQIDPSVAFVYAHEKFSGKAEYHTKSSELILQLTTGKPEYGFGLNLKYDAKANDFIKIIPALWWTKEKTNFVVKHDSNGIELGSIVVSYFQELSQTSRIASKITKNLKSGVVRIKVGGDWKLDDESVVKAKINSRGNLALAFTRELSKRLKATVATQVNTKSLVNNSESNYQLGFRFDFNS